MVYQVISDVIYTLYHPPHMSHFPLPHTPTHCHISHPHTVTLSTHTLSHSTPTHTHREQNKNLSDEIMHNIAVALQSPNISRYNYSDSAILTGSQEARAGWVSANYLNNSCSAFRVSGCASGVCGVC